MELKKSDRAPHARGHPERREARRISAVSWIRRWWTRARSRPARPCSPREREGAVGAVGAHRLQAPVLRGRGGAGDVPLREGVGHVPGLGPQVAAEEGVGLARPVLDRLHETRRIDRQRIVAGFTRRAGTREGALHHHAGEPHFVRVLGKGGGSHHGGLGGPGDQPRSRRARRTSRPLGARRASAAEPRTTRASWIVPPDTVTETAASTRGQSNDSFSFSFR